MFSARNTGDVWPLSYAGLLGFLRRVGSRVKRILFPRHYDIAARVAMRADRRYISAAGEEREFSRRFFFSAKAFFSRDEGTRRDFALYKGNPSIASRIRTYVRTKEVRCSRMKALRKYC